MRSTRFPQGLMILAAFAAGGSSQLMAVTDDFSDGTRSASPSGLDWYRIDSGTRPVLTVVNDDGAGQINGGNALNVDVSGSNQPFVGMLGSTITLGATPGDSVTLEFDLRFTDTVTSTGRSFRFGLFGDTDSQLGTGGWGTSDGSFESSSPGTVGDSGLWGRIGLGTGGTTGAIVAEPTNPDAILGGSGLDSYANASFVKLADTLAHHVELTITRTAAAVTYKFILDGLDDATHSVEWAIDLFDDPASSIITSYDYLVFMHDVSGTASTTSGQPLDYRIDNVSVTAAMVPEPASLGLAGAGLVSLMRRRRR